MREPIPFVLFVYWRDYPKPLPFKGFSISVGDFTFHKQIASLHISEAVLQMCSLKKMFLKSRIPPCSPINLLRISRTPFHQNTSGGLLPIFLRKPRSTHVFSLQAISNKSYFLFSSKASFLKNMCFYQKINELLSWRH